MAFADDFSAYPQNECIPEGQALGFWTSVFAGYGCNSVVAANGGAALSLSPQASTVPSETHSALVLGPMYEGSVQFGCGVTTAQQLRQGSNPNPWEVGWVVWHYTDNSHFYYFIAKTNGWELGKVTPDGQGFLATGNDPAFPVGNRNQILIQQDGATVNVTVNGMLLATSTDANQPYTSGQIGFYVEDANALYDSATAQGP